MNQYSNSARFLIAMTGAVVVAFATWKMRHPADATRTVQRKPVARSVASLRADEAKKARLERQAVLQPEGKATGSFSVFISGDDGTGASLESKTRTASRVHLRGTINAERATLAQEFSWIFPKGYRVLAGATTGLVPELQAGQNYEVSITIDRGGETLQPIVLHVFKLVGNEPRGQVAQFDIPDSSVVKPKSGSTADKGASVIQDYVQ